MRRLITADNLCNSISPLILGILLAANPPTTLAQQISVGEAADHAVTLSKLTTPGGTSFHLKAKIGEKDSPDSDFKADVEVFWLSPEKWRSSITSPGFAQTLILNGDKVSEQDTGDYYPFWLHELVTAMLDPLPMLESLKQTNAMIAKPSGAAESTSCARFQIKVGVPPVQNLAFYAFCFSGDHGLLDYVVTPQYSVVFKNYKDFEGKRVARLLVSDPEPGTTIEARITELSELTSVDESLFAISQPTPRENQLKSVIVSEANLKNMILQSPEIAWPSVRSGKTSGVLSLYISIDKSGRIRETFPLNSDNPGLDGAARQQVQEWQFKPAVLNGVPIQVESILTFAFNTRVENPVPVLSDADARKLATNTVGPQIAPGTAAPGTSFTVRVTVDVDGKLAGVDNLNKVPGALFLAAYKALTQWHFRPYLREGKPDVYAADITFDVH
jgi:Gram-negative bacterial TonB protein C-terminal